ncbi:hypothetical protein SLS62_009886 [Diatrype stigma]|uniref:Uncharacterized protein n=1 Tax=Diatrype stigma TaxID=117547 RepID=A0AAN9YHL0_9PEZI
MRDERTHPLLAQVPLTVSPFVSLPAAATLPYTYKSMPSTLPPPLTGVGVGVGGSGSSASEGDQHKPKYVVTPSAGYAAHPDEIVASCREVRARLARAADDMEAALRRFEYRIRERDLAEKRRVAPGWLDSDARLLEPEAAAAEAEAGVGTEIAGGRYYGTGAGAGAGATVADRFAGMSLSTTTTADHRGEGVGGPSEMAAVDEGAELDRAFGGLT